MMNPKTKDIDYECLLEFREEVIVDHSEQRRFQGGFWKTSSVSINHSSLHSFSPWTNSLYQLSLSPQFPFNLHFTASSILSPFEKSVESPMTKFSFNPWSTIIFSEQFSPSWTLYLLWFLDGNTLGKSVSISEFFVFPLPISVSQGPELSPPLFL